MTSKKQYERELTAEWEALQKRYASTPKFARKKVHKQESSTLSLKEFGNYRGAEALKNMKSLITPGHSTASMSKTDAFNIRNEPEHVKEAILFNAKCIAPLHKGTLVFVSSGMNPASLGRKNEVL